MQEPHPVLPLPPPELRLRIRRLHPPGLPLSRPSPAFEQHPGPERAAANAAPRNPPIIDTSTILLLSNSIRPVHPPGKCRGFLFHRHMPSRIPYAVLHRVPQRVHQVVVRSSGRFLTPPPSPRTGSPPAPRGCGGSGMHDHVVFLQPGDPALHRIPALVRRPQAGDPSRRSSSLDFGSAASRPDPLLSRTPFPDHLRDLTVEHPFLIVLVVDIQHLLPGIYRRRDESGGIVV